MTAEEIRVMRENEDIAQVAHEANRAYCETIGDHSQEPWAEAPEWQRASAINGVRAIREGRVLSPGDSHVSWMNEKLADGWTLGPYKDPELKQHPCLLPFEQLPSWQQAKDRLFLAVVQALL